ncbi:hypothetical protein [Jannaschia sp. W003]|uniref:hypothetical protein n=1 Tax=Jannaschia sp. W003 TaxID=2867012 RepID=UPI0021A39F39|nr:hypothetical protein [Jannaschia sp. W003]UWQ22472.1 hypothetical protein K3554_05450 [Jannaschia sp. W003]
MATTSPLPLANGLLRGLADPARGTRELVSRLGAEMATGRVADPAEALRHDFSALGLAERELHLAGSLEQSIGKGLRVMAAADAALGGIGDEIERLGDELVPFVTGSAGVPMDDLAASAWEGFERIVALMNARLDDGAIFAGGRRDAEATGSAAAIRADVEALAAGAADADDLQARVAAYFAPSGDFAANRVVPSAPDAFGFRIEADRSVAFDMRAGDAGFRDALGAVARIAALAASPHAETPEAQAYLATGAPAALATATDGVIGLRAAAGRTAAALDRGTAALEDRVARAAEARNALVGVDPYETATRLEEEAARLETIYTLTARLSRLRLTDYL